MTKILHSFQQYQQKSLQLDVISHHECFFSAEKKVCKKTLIHLILKGLPLSNGRSNNNSYKFPVTYFPTFFLQIEQNALQGAESKGGFWIEALICAPAFLMPSSSFKSAVGEEKTQLLAAGDFFFTVGVTVGFVPPKFVGGGNGTKNLHCYFGGSRWLCSLTICKYERYDEWRKKHRSFASQRGICMYIIYT